MIVPSDTICNVALTPAGSSPPSLYRRTRSGIRLTSRYFHLVHRGLSFGSDAVCDNMNRHDSFSLFSANLSGICRPRISGSSISSFNLFVNHQTTALLSGGLVVKKLVTKLFSFGKKYLRHDFSGGKISQF